MSAEYQGRQSGEWYRGVLSPDPKARPKRIDLAIQEAAFPRYAGKTAKAIYRIKDESLTVASNEPGRDEYPVAFERSDETDTRLFVLTRQEEEK